MAPQLVLIFGLATAVAIDVRSRRIPNWLTGAIGGAGFGIAFGGGVVTPAQAALGLLAGLLLMAAIGAVVGPGLVLRAFLDTAVAGGIFALAVATRRGLLAETLHGTQRLVTAPSAARQTIESPSRANRFPYGPAIAVGTFVALLA
jgi:prepilin peptidase CpaA